MRAALLVCLAPSLALAAPREADFERPVKWLLAAQNDDGGWGAEAKSKPDVATTALSAIALLRLGNSYTAGPHAASVRKATEFVVRAVEKTPGNEHAINPPGTQPQAKLGRYIDTFVGAQFLSEIQIGRASCRERGEGSVGGRW